MHGPPIDLRSDTVTRPTPAMRRAMAEAEVGDDVYGEDPTVTRLEAQDGRAAGQGGRAVRASGTMANQIGVGVNTQPGDDCSAPRPHTSTSGRRAGSPGFRASPPGRSRVTAASVVWTTCARIRPATTPHYVRTRLVCLENTHNRGGGRVHPIESIAEIARWAASTTSLCTWTAPG